jgi:8-oxo-dGTP pyrophosphatase MutT (NUDIX family)
MPERHKVHLNVYLILENDEGFLLSLRQNTGYLDGKWGLVAGHAEARETSKVAMCREAFEEAGIVIAERNLHIVHMMHRLTERENLDIFFKCNTWEGEIRNLEPHKCGGLEFFQQENFPTNTISYVAQAIDYYRKSVLYSAIGY